MREIFSPIKLQAPKRPSSIQDLTAETKAVNKIKSRIGSSAINSVSDALADNT